MAGKRIVRRRRIGLRIWGNRRAWNEANSRPILALKDSLSYCADSDVHRSIKTSTWFISESRLLKIATHKPVGCYTNAAGYLLSFGRLRFCYKMAGQS